MPPVQISRNDENIEAEASQWFARCDAGDLTQEEKDSLREWLERSPKHKEAWGRAHAVWRDLDEFFVVSGARADRRPAAANGLSRRFADRPRMAAMAIAAMLALLVAPAALLISSELLDRPAASLNQQYMTKVGERRLVPLPDGSTAMLNTNSQIEVAYEAETRSIRLLRGEAVFTVTRDSDRPFLVEASGSVVKAVGTAFAVRLRDEGVDVSVTEGQVEVAPPLATTAPLSLTARDAPAPVKPTKLIAGEKVSVNLASLEVHSVRREANKDIERELSWMAGMLVFDQDSLETVVDEVGRYTDMNIVIADPELRSMRVSGMFKVGETDALLGALETGFGLSVRRIPPNLIYISS